MQALKTVQVIAASFSLGDVMAALTEAKMEDGAPDTALLTFYLGGYGPQIKAEWTEDEPDHAEPAPDAREQPFNTTGVTELAHDETPDIF